MKTMSKIQTHRFVRGACRAFTLIELLVVIAIIALLISILLPTPNRSLLKPEIRSTHTAASTTGDCRTLPDSE